MQSEITVSQLFFINLAMRTDRLAHMRAQLEGCRWPVQRIEAVRLQEDPRNLGYEVVARLEGKRHFVGIWLSHRRALEAALEVEQPGAVILLEDDVSINTDLWSSELSLPAVLNSDWEILLLSPRYRLPRGSANSTQTRNKWIKRPFGDQPILLSSARRKYVCSGAHFCVFRDQDVIRRTLTKMDACEALYDVDLFYITQLKTYGLEDARVATAHYGSDHH